MTRRRAVVFAYHDVGVRCLLTVLASGIEVPLVITHRDSPAETIWFASVHDVAVAHDLDVIHAEDLDAERLASRVAAIAPDFIFSFYFRSMLPVSLLVLATSGAYNMHGSLLPRYRGRVPINWAIIHGETETGATLHEMVARPDAGAIVGQTPVPILPDDTARDVFGKVVVAAEQTLWRVLPGLIVDDVTRMPNDLSRGSYFGGRKAADGRIDWHANAKTVHDLIRAVAPPYPGATTAIDDLPVTIERSRLVDSAAAPGSPMLVVEDGRCVARCADGSSLRLLVASIDGRRHDEAALANRLGAGVHRLDAQ